LQEQQRRGRPQNVRRFVRDRSIERVVITNTHFDCLAGSQIVSLDIAALFRRSGVQQVIILTDQVSPAMEQLAQQHGIEILSLLTSRWTERLPTRIDLLWGHHWPLVGAMLLCAPVSLRYLVLSSLSAYEPLELNAFFATAADLRVYNSRETLQHVAPACVVDAPDALLPNSLADAWFQAGTPPVALGRIAILSNHAPDELMQAADILRAQGVEVEPVGMSGKPRLMDPAAIDGFDAIVTIGHSVQKAMARRRPVFLYDRFGGAGWLSPGQLDDSEAVNHSGRDRLRRRPADDLASEIVSGFSNALAGVEHLYAEAARRYRLDANLAALLRALPRRRWRTVDAAAPVFARDRSAVQAYWQEKMPALPLPLTAIGNAPGLPMVRAVMTQEAALGAGVRQLITHYEDAPIMCTAVAVLAEVGGLPIQGLLGFEDGAYATEILFRRDDGLLFRGCVRPVPPAEGAPPEMADTHFHTVLALAPTTRNFAISARTVAGDISVGHIRIDRQNDVAPGSGSKEV